MHICTIFLPWYFSPERRRLFICFFPFIFFTISHLKHLTDSTGSNCFFFFILGFSFFSLPNQHTLPGREIASCSHLLLVLHHPFVCAVVFFHPQLTTTKPSYPWWDFRGKSIAYQHNCFSSPNLPYRHLSTSEVNHSLTVWWIGFQGSTPTLFGGRMIDQLCFDSRVDSNV